MTINAAANKQFGKSTAEVLNSALGILMKFCTKFEQTFSKVVPSPSCRTLGAILPNRRPTININEKFVHLRQF